MKKNRHVAVNEAINMYVSTSFMLGKMYEQVKPTHIPQLGIHSFLYLARYFLSFG